MECAAKEYLRRMYIIRSSAMPDHKSVRITSVKIPHADTTLAGDRAQEDSQRSS